MSTSAEFPDLARIGGEIRSLRHEAGLTLAELAERARLSTRFLGDLERGRANVSLKGLLQVCAALEVAPESLFGGAGPDQGRRGQARRLLAQVPDSQLEVVTSLLEARLADPASRRFALIGLRGAGKTSVGAAVAARLDVPFLELDQRVEDAAGMPLVDLFAIHGEDTYRELEADALRQTLDAPGPLILATGGSLVSHPDSYATLRQRFVTCWLKATPTDHWDRVVAQGDHRPMQGHPAARQRLEELLTERLPLYAQAHHVVDTSSLGLADTIERVCHLAAPVVGSAEPYTPAP